LLGPLIDISEQGCGIYYVADRSTAGAFHSPKTWRLRIFGSFKMFEFKHNTVVYDNELIQYSNAQIPVRRLV